MKTTEVLAIAAVLSIGAHSAPQDKSSPGNRPPREQESDELVFKDNDGVVRMRVGLLARHGFRPGIEMFDPKGKRRALLELEDGGPVLTFLSADGPILTLEQRDDTGMPSIQLTSANPNHEGEWVKLILEVIRDSAAVGDSRGHIQVVQGAGNVVFETATKKQ